MAKEYTSVVIDKTNVGLSILQLAVAENGLQTARMLGIQLAIGSVKLEHDQHVFMWDDSTDGVTNRRRIERNGNCFLVRIRWPSLTETVSLLNLIQFSGTLKGDGGQNGLPSGQSPNGAWAYKGAIPWQFCYVDGLDRPDIRGFGDWKESFGWPPDQHTRHRYSSSR